MAKISAKKLIERIEHLKEIEYSSYRGYDEKYEKALNDAIDIIHALNAETAEKKEKERKEMKDTEKYINVADLKRKLRYIFKQYEITKYMQNVYIGIIDKIPYSVKGQLEQTIEVKENETVKCSS